MFRGQGTLLSRRHLPLCRRMSAPRLLLGNHRHHRHQRLIGMNQGKAMSSLIRMNKPRISDHCYSICKEKMPATAKALRGSTARRQKVMKRGARLSTSEAGSAAEPSSEEIAQQLSQLLQQPLALEAFIAKELTSSQRQAIQRLLDQSDVDTVNVPEPSMQSLRLVAINTSIPFVGFGIMDNMM